MLKLIRRIFKPNNQMSERQYTDELCKEENQDCIIELVYPDNIFKPTKIAIAGAGTFAGREKKTKVKVLIDSDPDIAIIRGEIDFDPSKQVSEYRYIKKSKGDGSMSNEGKMRCDQDPIN